MRWPLSTFLCHFVFHLTKHTFWQSAHKERSDTYNHHLPYHTLICQLKAWLQVGTAFATTFVFRILVQASEQTAALCWKFWLSTPSSYLLAFDNQRTKSVNLLLVIIRNLHQFLEDNSQLLKKLRHLMAVLSLTKQPCSGKILKMSKMRIKHKTPLWKKIHHRKGTIKIWAA